MFAIFAELILKKNTANTYLKTGQVKHLAHLAHLGFDLKA